VRIPTGGGKTVLGAHIIKAAAETWLEQERPLVLWLVPTTQIKTQTLEAFKNPRHAYRRELDDAFDGKVAVFDIGEIEQIRPADLAERVCVVIATFATARVNDTALRDFYAHKEMLEPHFLGLDHATLDGLAKTEHGEPAFSFANLLRLRRPLVITDEAHNANTKLSFEVYQRLSPAAIVELTATPDYAHSNVLVRVSASELKAEEMIKLPVVLTEHPSGDWRDAVRDALLRRKQLEEVARGEEPEFVRPIVLIQAENDNLIATVAAVKAHLLENEHLRDEQIAIATGDQRELDGVDLFARDCKVEAIITKQALKEGWDCSFAYVFCSVAKVRSGRDVEQLLGRVLRMPYARRRRHEDLNKAYAHVLSTSFGIAAEELTEQLVDMGFEDNEAASNIEVAPSLFPDLKLAPAASLPLWLTVETAKAPELSALPAAERSAIQVETKPDGGFRVIVSGSLSDAARTALVAAGGKKTEREQVERSIAHHELRIAARLTPAQRHLQFDVPWLSYRQQGQLFQVEPELFLDLFGWDLLDHPPDLSSLRFDERTQTFLLDLEEEEMHWRHVREDHPAYLQGLAGEWSQGELVAWLDKRLRKPDVTQSVMLEWVRRAVDSLVASSRFTLAQLVRAKFLLARKLDAEITSARVGAQAKNYQQTLFAPDAPIEVDFEQSYRFDPLAYPVPAARIYSGKYQFRKHYYATLGDLRYKRADGHMAEEFNCAMQLDSLEEVEFWVRNLVHPTAFWLPLMRGRTYPDFVAKLKDGRLFVIEYKGGDRVTNENSKAKKQIGELWEQRSNGRALYLMATSKDELGRDVRAQLLAKVRTG
jgi:type III restriction enzyme